MVWVCGLAVWSGCEVWVCGLGVRSLVEGQDGPSSRMRIGRASRCALPRAILKLRPAKMDAEPFDRPADRDRGQGSRAGIAGRNRGQISC